MTRTPEAIGAPAPRPNTRGDKAAGSAVAIAACMALGAPPAAAQAPAIDIQSRAEQWLLAGSPDDPYWVIDNRWGQGSIPNGAFSQGVGGGSSADGRIAFRMQWQWPQGDTEVKGYPAALYGRKPGYAGYTASLLQGAGIATSSNAATAGLFPLKLPVTPLKAHVAVQHNAPPTGQGHLTFDLWLQSDPRQDNGWTASSITHEIMVPLDLWGNYGAHQTPGGRNPGWYDHDATIAGKLYHVYITKDGDGCSRYDFGSLNGSHGKTGWKLIAFVPAQLPVPAGEIDLAAIVNHVATRKDACGEPWTRGDEYLVSAELGVEPVVGSGDISVYDYKLSNTGVTATGTTVVVPARALGGGSNAGAGGNSGNGGGSSNSGSGSGGNAGNAGNAGNGGAAGGGGGNTGSGNAVTDDDARKGKDKHHKYEQDGGRYDKNGNRSRPVVVSAPSESTEGTAPAGSTDAPPATSPPPATGAALPPPSGTTLPPPAGTNVPPAVGSALPPPAGATLPPPAGATLPPPAGATVPPPSGATPAPGADSTPDASSSVKPPAPATSTAPATGSPAHPPVAQAAPPATATSPAAATSTTAPASAAAPAATATPAPTPAATPATPATAPAAAAAASAPAPVVSAPAAASTPSSTAASSVPSPAPTPTAAATDEPKTAIPANPTCNASAAKPVGSPAPANGAPNCPASPPPAAS